MAPSPDPDQERDDLESVATRHETELLVRFQEAGDADAFSTLFDRTAPALLRVALHQTRNRADAEDLLQATYLTAIQKRRRFDREHSPMAWLVGILVNHRRMQARTRARELRRNQEHAERVGSGVPVDPEFTTQNAEFDARIREAIDALPSPYGEVVRLHFGEGLAPREVARELRRPAATIRSQLSRGLEILRKRLPREFTLAGLPFLGAGEMLAGVRARVVASALRPAPVAATAALWLLAAAAVLVAVPTWLWLRRIEVVGDKVAAAASQAPAEDVPAAPDRSAVADSRPGAASSLPALVAPEVRVVRARDRSPVAGAPLLLLLGRADAVREYLLPERRQVVLTDERGVATFAPVPRGSFARISLDEIAWRSREIVVGERAIPEIEVNVVQFVSGRVTAADGSAIAGAEIRVGDRLELAPGFAVARTDADGRYRAVLAGLSDSLKIWALAPGHAASVAFPLALYDGATEADLQLGEVVDTVRGCVVTEDGAPGSGCVVVAPSTRSARGLHPTLLTIADAEGHFALEGVGREHLRMLVAFGDRLAPAVQGFTQNSELVVFRMGRGGSLRGRILHGTPVEPVVADNERRGVALSVMVHPQEAFRERALVPWLTRAASLDERGEYWVTHLATGESTASLIEVENPGRMLAGADLVIGHGTTTWHPDAHAVRPLAIEVVDDHGEPLADSLVRIRPGTPEGKDLAAVDSVTDARGRIEVLSLADGEYDVRVFPPRARLPATPWLATRITVGDRRQQVVVPSARRAVQARVVSANGEPASALLRLWRVGTETAPTLQTDAQGRLELSNLAPGRYEGIVQNEAEMAWIRPFELEATRDHDLGTLVLAPFGSLALVAKGADGKRLRGMRASWWHEIPNLHAGLQTPSARVDDVVTIQRCAPGKWFVKLEAPGHCARVCELEVHAGQRARSSIDLVPGVTVRLHVAVGHRGNDALHADVRTTIQDARGNPVDTLVGRTSTDALVQEFVLREGRYRIVVATQYGTSAATELEVRGSEPVDAALSVR